MRVKIPDLAQALEGSFEEHHARMAKAILNRLDLVEQSLADLDVIIRDQCAPWAHEIELLQTIPGVGERVAQVIIAETGGDMSQFPSAAHLAAWAGVAPGIHESAGKRTPTGSRHGNKWLTSMLVEAAGSVARMHGKNYLAAQHARLSRRRGAGRAQVAVGHSILGHEISELYRGDEVAGVSIGDARTVSIGSTGVPQRRSDGLRGSFSSRAKPPAPPPWRTTRAASAGSCRQPLCSGLGLCRRRQPALEPCRSSA